MRLDIGFDHDLPERSREREIALKRDVRPPAELAIERERKSDPILQRLDSLRERAGDHRLNHQPPRREREGQSVSLPKDRTITDRTVSVPRRTQERTVSHERRPQRHHLPHNFPGIQLRPEERKLLHETGRFRVLRTEDLRETIYDGRKKQLENDLVYLRSKGLVQTQQVNLRRDGRRREIERVEVVALTKQGRDLVRRSDDLVPDQKVYAELVKPREVEHDSQIYRAFLKEAEKIEKNGGRNLRVQLDFELKAQAQKAIYRARKEEPERNLDEIKEEVAQQFELPYVDHHIQIPDARIRYERDGEQGQGTIAAHSDIEVVTAAYRSGQVRAKAQAGFHIYASASDRSSLTTRIEHDHELLFDILDL